MKKIYLLIFVMMTFSLTAQFDIPSVGQGYSKINYYNIEDGATTQHDLTTWDLAFSTGTFDAGIFVNEGVGLSFTITLTEVELYLTTSADFASADSVGMSRIYNNEASWSEGAFNHVKDAANSADLGWGDYSSAVITGTRIFVIKLRNGDYKKLLIESLIDGVYTIKYANLDGSNETTKTITKTDFAGKTLAYFSFDTESTIDLEPENWDLFFARYSTPLDAGGTFIDYVVTGVLSNTGVEVAQADFVDPSTVNYLDFEDEYNDTLTTIGHDWKSYNGGWEITAERVYFVKTKNQKIWQIEFIDFGGFSSGDCTLKKTFLTDLTAVDDVYKNIASFSVFPNPATDFVQVAFELKTTVPSARLKVINQLGQVIQDANISIHNGLNVNTLPLNLTSGVYYISLQIGNDFITKSLIVK